MRFDVHAKALTVGGAAAAALLMWGAPSAGADPLVPVPPPPAPVGPAPVGAVPLDAAGQPVAAPLPTLPDGVPHLASPEALPPGSTMDPAARGNESANMSYLKDLWHAVQSQEISGGEALLMGIAQRGMDTPYPEQPGGPNVPLTPVDPAAAPPPVNPAAPPPPAPVPPPPVPTP